MRNTMEIDCPDSHLFALAVTERMKKIMAS